MIIPLAIETRIRNISINEYQDDYFDEVVREIDCYGDCTTCPIARFKSYMYTTENEAYTCVESLDHILYTATAYPEVFKKDIKELKSNYPELLI